MKQYPSLIVRSLVLVAAVAACSRATQVPVPVPPRTGTEERGGVLPGAPGDSGRRQHIPAEVRFMSGMIHHHAQALLMAGWAPTHDASAAVRVLCERIVVGQQDEIAFMQRWLRDRQEPVPELDPAHTMMPGMNHSMLMPGMLTSEQLAQLGGASGSEFDRLFLAFMIQHHQGALSMVQELFGVPGAGEDDNVFKFVSDMNADQTIEIDRMRAMLDALPAGGRNP